MNGVNFSKIVLISITVITTVTLASTTLTSIFGKGC